MSHATFIVTAYAIAAGTILLIAGKLLLDYRALRRDLAKFPQRDEAGR